MLYPLLPLYLSSVLMTGPGALGFIEGLAEATSSLLKLCSGLLADRLPKIQWLIVSGYALASFSRPLLAFATSWPGVLGLRLVDRVGKGLRSSPRDALLAASVDPVQRGLAFGLHRSMDNAGAVLGPAIATALLAWDVPLRSIFLWSLVPGVLTVLLTLFVQEPAEQKAPGPRVSSPPLLSPAELPTALKRYLWTAGLFALGNASNMFLLLRAKELGLTESQIPALWALLSLVAALFTAPLGALSDRVGRVRMLVIGWILYAGFYLILGLIQMDLMGMAIWFAGYGTFLAATEGVEKAFVADLAPVTARGTAFGWFNMVTGLTALPASLVFGLIYEHMSPSAAFIFGAVCAISAVLLMLLWVKPTQKPSN